MLHSRPPWWVCGGDTDPRHLPISASFINRKQSKTVENSSSLRNKRPGLSGRPPCKGVAIGIARRGTRLGGERTLRIFLSCSDPASHAGGPHVASFVVGRSCACVCAGARVRACARAWRNALRVRALPKHPPVARGDSARKLVTGPLGRSGPQVLCRGVGNGLLRPQSPGRGCPLHWADGPTFTGG